MDSYLAYNDALSCDKKEQGEVIERGRGELANGIKKTSDESRSKRNIYLEGNFWPSFAFFYNSRSFTFALFLSFT